MIRNNLRHSDRRLHRKELRLSVQLRNLPTVTELVHLKQFCRLQNHPFNYDPNLQRGEAEGTLEVGEYARQKAKALAEPRPAELTSRPEQAQGREPRRRLEQRQAPHLSKGVLGKEIRGRPGA